MTLAEEKRAELWLLWAAELRQPERGARGAGASTTAGAAGGTAGRAGSAGEEGSCCCRRAATTQVAQAGAPSLAAPRRRSWPKLLGGRASAPPARSRGEGARARLREVDGEGGTRPPQHLLVLALGSLEI